MIDRTSLGVLRSPPVCITLNSRSGRPLPMNERVHLSNVVRRLPNPVRKVRWTNAHTTQPGKPAQAQPMEVHDGPEPPDGGRATEVAVLEGGDRFALLARRIVLAACRPPCMATSATPGRLLSAIMSPTTNTSGCPGTEQSGSTAMRPARSSSAPVALASSVARGDASTPAAQIVVYVASRVVLPSPSAMSTPAASIPNDPSAHP